MPQNPWDLDWDVQPAPAAPVTAKPWEMDWDAPPSFTQGQAFVPPPGGDLPIPAFTPRTRPKPKNLGDFFNLQGIPGLGYAANAYGHYLGAITDPEFWTGLPEAAGMGVGRGMEGLASTYGQLVEDNPNVRTAPREMVDEPIDFRTDTPAQIGLKSVKSIGEMAPTLLVAIAGAEAGAPLAVGLRGSEVAGSTAGFTLGTLAQQLGPNFRAAMAKYPGDKERAYREAIQKTDLGAAGAALGGSLASVNPFSTALRGLLFQTTIVQPAIGIGQTELEKNLFPEEGAGATSSDDLLNEYLAMLGPGLGIAGVGQIAHGLGAPKAEAKSLPPSARAGERLAAMDDRGPDDRGPPGPPWPDKWLDNQNQPVAPAETIGLRQPGVAPWEADPIVEPGTRERPTTDVEAAAAQVEPEPTEGQKKAGNYRKGHVDFAGFDVTLENPKGGMRRGTDAEGKPWEVEMPAHYGYLTGTKGNDGDHLDVYLGDHPDAPTVYAIDQIDADTGKFDEHKFMLGFPDQDAAVETYNAGFSDGRGPDRMGAVTPLTVGQFRALTEKPGARRKPISELVDVTRGAEVAPWERDEVVADASREAAPERESSGTYTLSNEPADLAAHHPVYADPELVRTVKGNPNYQNFVIMRDGKPAGYIEGGLRDDGRTFYIGDMKVEGGEGTLRPGQVRAMERHLRQMLPPSVKRIAGLREGVEEISTDRLAERELKQTPKREAKAKQPKRLTDYLRQIGGIREYAGEVRHMGGHRRPGLLNNTKRGVHLDEAARMAAEAGYLEPRYDENGDLERPDMNHLLEALYDDLNGRPVYSREDAGQLDVARRAEREARGSEYKAPFQKVRLNEEARPGQPTPEQAEADYKSASKAYEDVRRRYNDKQVGDEEFLAARKRRDDAMAITSVLHGNASDMERARAVGLGVTGPKRAPKAPATDRTHLNALELRLSNERNHLARAKTEKERDLRKVWIAQIEKEIAREREHLGGEDAAASVMSDDDLLAALNEPTTERTAAGEQTVLPGAEQIPLREQLERSLTGRKGTEKSQKDTGDLPLFDTNAGKQGTLKFQKARGLVGEGAPFYSALDRGVQDLKADRMVGKQWLATLRNRPGIKGEELEATGLADWLNEHADDKVTKAEVEQHLHDNAVQLEEHVAADDTSPNAALQGRAIQAREEFFAAMGREGYARDQVEEMERDHELGGVLRAFPEINRLYERANAAGEAYDAVQQADTENPQGWGSVGGNETKFGEYTLPGGTNYREMKLTLPPKETPERTRWNYLADRGLRRTQAESDEYRTLGMQAPSNYEFRSSHFPEANIIAHARLKDRVGPSGEKILHVEELQSDWHQKGRRQGYKSDKVDRAEEARLQKEIEAAASEVDKAHQEKWKAGRDTDGWREAEARERDAVQRMQSLQGDRDNKFRTPKVPDAPFKKTWHELLLKRLIRYASENGYDKIAITPGEMQADRYDLSKQVRRVLYRPTSKELMAWRADSGRDVEPTIHERDVTPEKLPDIIGKEAARKLLEQKQDSSGAHVLSGVDLKVGGEGMKGFYDKIVPDFLNKYGKKFGAKVGTTSIDIPGGIGQWRYEGPDHTLTEVEQRYERGRRGMDVRATDVKQLKELYDAMERGDSFKEAIERNGSYALAEGFGGKLIEVTKGQELPSIDITPQMRSEVMQGQPLFQKTAVTRARTNENIKWARDTRAEFEGALKERDIDPATSEKDLRALIRDDPELKGIFDEMIDAYREAGGLAAVEGRARAKPTLKKPYSPWDDVDIVPLKPEEVPLFNDVIDVAEKIFRKMAPRVGRAPVRRMNARLEGEPGSPTAGLSLHDKTDGLGPLILYAMEYRHPETGRIGDLTRTVPGTVRHEIIHYLEDEKFFTTPEMDTLRQTADEKGWIKKHKIDKNYQELLDYYGPELGHRRQLSEAIAEEYGVGHPSRWKGLPEPVRKLFFRLDDLFRRVYGAVKRALGDKMNAQDIFHLVERGVVGSREPISNDAQARAQRQAVREDRKGMPLFRPKQSIKQELLGAASTATGRLWAKMDAVRIKTQDKMLRLKRTQEAVERARESALPEAENAYQAEELYHGRTGEQLDRFRVDEVEPLTKAIGESGLDVSDVNDFLYARHAPERNAQIARLDPNMKDGGSGMTNLEAKTVMEDFAKRGLTPKLEAVARMVDRIRAETLNVMEKGDLIDPDTRAKWEGTYKDYVPLRGFENANDPFGTGEAERARIGRGFDIRGKESKRAMGRKSRAGDILAHVLSQHEEAVVRAEKNRVGKTFLRLVEQNPEAGLWTVDTAPIAKRIDKASGLVKYEHDPRYQLADNVLAVKIGGNAHYITIKDPALARAMKNLGSESLDAVTNFIARGVRFLSRMATQWNPAFTIPNLTRDLQTAVINMKQMAPELSAAAIVRDVPLAMKNSFQAARGADKTTWQKWYHEFANEGGKISFFGLDDIESRSRKIRGLVKAARPGHVPTIRRALNEVGQFLGDINGAVENATRLSVYANLRRKNYSRAKAASIARNVTVNFNRKGEWGPYLNTMYMFFNASTQGSVTMLRALAKSRKVQAIAAGGILMGFMQDYINAMFAPQDDDGENRWDKISQWTKDHNLIVMNPYATGKEEDDIVAFKVPMPYGYNVFPMLGTRLSELVRGKEGRTPLNTATSLAAGAIDAFDPTGAGSDVFGSWEGAARGLTPTILKPAIELAVNQDYAGRPIQRPKEEWGKTIPESQRGFSSVGPVAKWLTNELNEATGGSKVRPGALDVSPAALDHWFEFATGGLGRTIKQALELPARVGDESLSEPRNWPVVNRFIEGKNKWYDNQRFYQIRDALEITDDEIKGLLKSGDKAEALRVRGQRAAEVKAIPWFKAADKQLTKLFKLRRLIEARQAAGKPVKEGELDRVAKQIRDTQIRAIRAYQDALKRAGVAPRPAEPVAEDAP